MSASSPQIIIYIASSLDGIIAGPGDDLTFLDRVQTDGEDYGYGAFLDSVDTVIIGRKTYDWVMAHVETFPHEQMNTYVITKTPRPSIGNITFYNGDLSELVMKLKSAGGKNIFCDGGAQIINELLRLRAVDEIIVSIVPVLLGKGTRLFSTIFSEQELQLISARSYPSGLVQTHYRVLH